MKSSIVGLLYLAAMPALLSAADLTESEAVDLIEDVCKVYKEKGTVVIVTQGDSTSIKDEHLRAMRAFKSLRKLTISDYRRNITDAGARELGKITSLKELYLGSPELTDATFVDFKELTNLTLLRLSTESITDRGLASLKDMKELASLEIVVSRITDAGIKELVSLPKLKSLALFAPKSVNGTGFRGLKVTSLSLNRVTLSDEGLKEIGALTELEALDLTDAGVKNDDLRNLGKLEQLKTLTLSANAITDDGLKNLIPLKKLTNLTVPTAISDAAIKDIRAAMPALTTVRKNR